MKVSELVGLLNKVDPNITVLLWDPFYDKPSEIVHISKYSETCILINTDVIGEEIS